MTGTVRFDVTETAGTWSLVEGYAQVFGSYTSDGKEWTFEQANVSCERDGLRVEARFANEPYVLMDYRGHLMSSDVGTGPLNVGGPYLYRENPTLSPTSPAYDWPGTWSATLVE